MVDFWDDEVDAIGIAHPRERNLLVYVCAYYTGYFASTEFPNNNPEKETYTLPYNKGKECKDIGFDELLNIIRKHFDIKNTSL